MACNQPLGKGQHSTLSCLLKKQYFIILPAEKLEKQPYLLTSGRHSSITN